MPPIPTNTPVIQMRRPQFGGSFGFEIRPVHPDVVAEVLDYVFNSKAWRSNPELLKRRVQQWRLQLFEDSPGVLSTGATSYPPPPLFAHAPIFGMAVHVSNDPAMADGISLLVANTPDENQESDADEADPDTEWIERGVALRMEGTSWNKLEEMLGRNRSTVRRVIGRTLTERGLTPPTSGN